MFKSYKTVFCICNLLLVTSLISIGSVFNSCKNKSNSTYQFTGDTLKDGKQLVQLHCKGCHELTPVNALTKDVWMYHTLPSMAHYLGISTYGIDYFKPDSITRGTSLAEWQTIVAYYKKLAPITLPSAKRPDSLVRDWAGFTLKTPKPLTNDFSFTTMISVNPFDHQVYTSDEKTHQLTAWTSGLKDKIVTTLPSSAVQADFFKDLGDTISGTFTCVGELQPMDFPNGKVLKINLNQKNNTDTEVISSELLRPVQTLEGDFYHNGHQDKLILCQGDKRGKVVLMKQNLNHSFTQNLITEKPGAAQAISGDFNKDGWLDFMVLYGIGDEGLWMYLNNQKGSFTAKALLKFPPVYGSSSFQLEDLDHDGLPDLIYSCGYNYHDSRILKPYHGLYIFKNTGRWNFKQTWFYPINGCTKAIATDFDGDGDLDIATSAFFADLKDNPAEGFIYFEQDKPMHFIPHAMPVSKYGRWMCMTVADYNSDGKPDILLGNFAQGLKIQNVESFWNKQLPFVVLQNNFKK
jgi:hypothetical protein